MPPWQTPLHTAKADEDKVSHLTNKSLVSIPEH